MEEMSKQDRERFIAGLGFDDIKKMSELQLRFAQQVSVERLNEKATKIVRETMKDEEEKIVAAMTMPPFSYITPEIQIMAGCRVKFATLTNDQISDAYAAADEFAREGDPNDMRVAQHLNKLLLAHSLVSFRGEEFGGASMPENYHEIVRSDPKGAKEALVAVRESRMEALGYLPVPIFQRLVEFYSAFQIAAEAVTKGDSLADILGN